MNKLTMSFILLMIALTVIAVIPMFGMPTITYGYGNYTIALTPAMVVIILSLLYLFFTIIIVIISYTVSSHLEKSVSGLAQKLADCQFEKNKAYDELEKTREELNHIKELYEKQLKVIEKVTDQYEEKEKSEENREKDSSKENTETA